MGVITKLPKGISSSRGEVLDDITVGLREGALTVLLMAVSYCVCEGLPGYRFFYLTRGWLWVYHFGHWALSSTGTILVTALQKRGEAP